MSRLRGKHALITGASRGIGAAIAERFVAEGARVLICDVRDADGSELARELGSNARYEHLDVTDEADWGRVLRGLAEDPVNVLVNNAGGVISFDPLDALDPALWRSIVELNLTSVFLGMRFVIPHLLAQAGGVIVNICSISGVVGHDVAPAYQAAKGGIRVLTKNGAITYARRGIRVNSLHPGIIDTPMVAEQPEWATQAFIAGTPMGRAGDPIDVAHAAVYLASDEAAFVTGAELYVDGGFVAQ
jgi:NAD(P)-dependent dehydrogenase (short-subunit alcohol dehydrogenase family)